MSKRNYIHIQVLLPEIEAMIPKGKTQREVAEHFDLKISIKGFLNAGDANRDNVVEQAYEIHRLQMENKLLRDFLQFMRRK